MTSNSTMSQRGVLTLQNPVFCGYLICSCLLVLKMIFVALFTVYKRMTNKALSPETANKGLTIDHESVELVRRAHLNDLENIPIFWTSAFAYLFTEPNVVLAFFLFFGFTVVRYFHTVVYAVIATPRHVRGVLFIVGLCIVLYMSMHSMIVGFASL